MLSWEMSGPQRHSSFPKSTVLLVAVVFIGVSFYRALITQLNMQVSPQFRNPLPILQEKPTEALKNPSRAVGKEEVTLEDQLKLKPKVVLFWTSWFNSHWAAKKGVLAR